MKTKKKLLKTGKYSYILSIPKDWINQMGWRAKQMLELELKEKEIQVRDFANKKKKSKS